ncbi:methionine--tRNA ligase [Niveispirillum sp. SYP-B3756]|uniref:methionine--tRNA ligase n=1 Tax=Niveispirillum sp. SYP-B3756 TaxID=2662178 RepID=UPI001290A9F7|nr:methionine--tRNA ligase [Niveispirillum sp. SYP-B3756]MQP65333.1 methionine--tRNA ligase [Niveispirillum sp. SYP-B3756]
MSGRAPYYITTPIYYVNDAPHVGHAYTTIACDVLARFKRLDGFDVKFLTGTDEHGQKVQKSAENFGTTPQALADKNSQNFRDLAALLNISNTDFIRTTEPRHIKAVQAVWQKLLDNGDIYLGSYKGWYSVRDEAYYGEDELTERNGQRFAPTGAPVEWVEEPSYFFKLASYGEKLLKLYEEQPDFIMPSGKRSEVISFVKTGLRDLSVSRTTFDWGVKVPGDEKHVMYVWLDALVNYITAIGYPETGEGTDFARYWPADLHMVGKDILRFHTVYWPAFLMAAGLPLPRRVFAHGWWTVEGEKMSKSLGNVVKPQELLDTYGLDQTRYFLLREIPFGNDGDFSKRAMMQRINGELANDYGNLCQRVLSMIQKYHEGKVPQPDALTDADNTLLGAAAGMLDSVRAELNNQAFNKALDAIWRVVGDANRYVDEMAPWTLRKTDQVRLGTVLYNLADVIRQLAIMTQPFMPDSSARILDQLVIPADQRGFGDLLTAKLVPGTPLPAPQPAFPRYVAPEAEETK